MNGWKVASGIALFAALIAGLYAFIFVPNYKECREHGHGFTYCTAIHLVR